MKYIILLFILCIQTSSAVTFRIDYTYDTAGFFGDPNDPADERKERRDAIEAVANFFSELLKDDFLQIDASEFSANFTWTPVIFHPETGNVIDLPQNTVVPANEIPIFVGTRDLPGGTLGSAGPGGFSQASGNQEWFDRIRMRGQSNLITDVAPWGGSIAFDSVIDWNFSLVENQTGFEFVSVALHEFCHILGIGISDSWENRINEDDLFTGPAVMRSFGSAPPVQAANANNRHGHFENANASNSLNSVAFGSFGASHGFGQRVIMLSSIFDTGNSITTMSDLDLAALIDIGWEVQVPLTFNTFSISGSSASLQLPTSSFLNYQLRRSINLDSDFINLGGVSEGNGTINTFEDTAPPPIRAFYQVEASPVFPGTGSGAAQSALLIESLKSEKVDEIRTIKGEISLPVTGCNCLEE